MRYNLFLLILIVGCVAVPVHKPIEQTPEKSNQHSVNSNSDSIWNKLIVYSKEHDYTIKSMDKSAGTMVINIKDVPISYLNNNGKINDTSAIGLVDIRRRVSNYAYVYPQKGYVDCLVLLIKKDESTSGISVHLKNRCSITVFYESGVVNKRLIPNVQIQSLGKIEKEIISYIQ